MPVFRTSLVLLFCVATFASTVGSIEQADAAKAYAAVKKIKFEGMQYRTDISETLAGVR